MVILMVFTAVDSDVDPGSQRTRHQGVSAASRAQVASWFPWEFNGIGRIW